MYVMYVCALIYLGFAKIDSLRTILRNVFLAKSGYVIFGDYVTLYRYLNNTGILILLGTEILR